MNPAIRYCVSSSVSTTNSPVIQASVWSGVSGPAPSSSRAISAITSSPMTSPSREPSSSTYEGKATITHSRWVI